MKILPQQSEFPKLVSNIFPDVCHCPIRTHDDLVLRILFLFCLLCVLCVLCTLCANSRLFFLLPRHNPATRHLPARRQLNRARFLQHFERRIPKLQVQDFALPRQQLPSATTCPTSASSPLPSSIDFSVSSRNFAARALSAAKKLVAFA